MLKKLVSIGLAAIWPSSGAMETSSSKAPRTLSSLLSVNPASCETGSSRRILADPKEICDTFYLALTIYREARGEPLAGKAGVAHTVLNRVANPTWWGNSIDSVVTKKWQFSSLTDPNDKQLTKWPLLTDSVWQACLQCAIECLNGTISDPTGGATHFFVEGTPAPKWVDTDAQYNGRIGNHNFYQRTA